jgi:succinate dehydrogenase/fumarate reductase flavoprotein subunit
MWNNAGVVRDRGSLEAALGRIESLRSEELGVRVKAPGELSKFLVLRNMLLVSEMICRAAHLRTESRGAHFRSDYPEEDNAGWLKNIVIRKADQKMRLDPVPVPPGGITPETADVSRD